MKYDPSRWKPVTKPNGTSIFEKSVRIARPPLDVFDFCCQGENFQKISPDRITPCRDTDDTTIRANGVYSFRHWMWGFLPVRWVVHIARFEPAQEFVDLLLEGPFRYFRHTHRCEPVEGGTLYSDVIEYRSFLGPLVDRTYMRRTLEKLFAHRHRKMQELLEGAQN